MKTHQHCLRMSALAYLYDNLRHFPIWFQELTRGQLDDISEIIAAWQTQGDDRELIPLEEIERREILRAVTLCDGDIVRAATALEVGKTTIYRKLHEWGPMVRDRVLVHQAAALAQRVRGLRVMQNYDQGTGSFPAELPANRF